MNGNLTSANSADAPRRMAMLIYPGVAPLDVAGPLQVFGVANFLSKQKLYDVVTVAPTADPIATPTGIAFLPSCAMNELPLPVDTLLVSGGGGPDAGCEPAIARLAQASGAAHAPFRLDLHRRLCTRRRRPHRRQAGDDALGLWRRTGAAQPHGHGGRRSDLHSRRQSLHLGRHYGGDRPRFGAGRGRSRPRPGARRRALSRSVPQAQRRPDAIFDTTGGAILFDSGHPERSSSGVTTISTAIFASPRWPSAPR